MLVLFTGSLAKSCEASQTESASSDDDERRVAKGTTRWRSALSRQAQDSTLVQAAAGGAVAALLFEGASAMECRRGHFQILETFGAQRFVTPHPCITFPPDVHSTCVEREATVRSFKDADAAEAGVVDRPQFCG